MLETGSLIHLALFALRQPGLACVCASASAITFEVPKNGKRCVSEDVNKDVLVVGDYTVADLSGLHLTIKVGAFERANQRGPGSGSVLLMMFPPRRS